MIGSTETRCLLAVLSQTRPTVRSVAAEVGRSTMTAHYHLTSLRERGLVSWEDGKAGTLRATCGVVDLDFCCTDRTRVRPSSDTLKAPKTNGPERRYERSLGTSPTSKGSAMEHDTTAVNEGAKRGGLDGA